MKKIFKYLIIIITIIICIITAIIFYQKINQHLIIEEKRKIVETDEVEYGNNYEKFSSQSYKEKPARIIFKKENTIDSFYVFDTNNEEYERVLKVVEDRMFYSAAQDFNLWCFTPYTLDDISNSNENFIVFDYNDNIENKNYEYDFDFNKAIFFRFSNSTRLYRLMDYLSYINTPINKEELKVVIGKDDFITKENITSGYRYMNPTLLLD